MKAPIMGLAQYRALVEHSPVMIWRSGLDAKCDYFNETWLAFSGKTLEQELGDGWVEGVHPDDVDRCVEIYLSSFARREAFEMEYRLCRHDGVYRYIFDRGVPFHDDDGRFAGYIGSCVDVHDRREAERTKTMFLTLLAHELRTPLTSMKTYLAGLVRRVAHGKPAPPELLGRVTAQIGRFEELLGEMNDAARLEARQPLALEDDEVDLAALARDVVAEAEARLRFGEETGAGRRHTISLEIDGGPALARGDRRRLAQALGCLVENAVKFSPHGGVVRIRLAHAGGEHVISVADSGIGIPREEIGSLGRPYFRASNAPAESYPGLGLGLSIARDVVERHGGRMWFESQPGAGTTARLSLPERRVGGP